MPERHASETWPLTKTNLQHNDRAMIRQICSIKQGFSLGRPSDIVRKKFQMSESLLSSFNSLSETISGSAHCTVMHSDTIVLLLYKMIADWPNFCKANLRNIFVSPYPTLFNWYGSVGRKIILFYFPNSIPIKLNCN